MTSGVGPRTAAGGFEVFFESHYPEVVRALSLATGDRARAEDAAQEAFATALRRWPDVSGMDRPVGWVLVVATNQLRRWMARTERRLVPVAEPIRPARPPGAVGPAGVDHDGPEHDVSTGLDLRAALDRLPPRQRATVVLRHLCDLSTAEVAEALGCAEGTVKSALHAGLAALRVDLGDEDRPPTRDGAGDATSTGGHEATTSTMADGRHGVDGRTPDTSDGPRTDPMASAGEQGVDDGPR